MPPRKVPGKSRGKAKAPAPAPARSSPRKRQEEGEGDSDSPSSGEESVAESVTVRGEEAAGQEAAGQEGQRQKKEMEEEEAIAQFFEDRTYFYDPAHEEYKNRQRKDAEKARLAAQLGGKWDGEYKKH